MNKGINLVEMFVNEKVFVPNKGKCKQKQNMLFSGNLAPNITFKYVS